jgi:septum formation protein
MRRRQRLLGMTLSQACKAKLVLASASPRRAELLRNAGIPFVVEAAKIDESRRKNEPPTEYARRLAAEKARAVAKKRQGDFVLGADTIVVVDEQVLEKPRDRVDAARMLKLLSGRRHLVTTGVCLIGPAEVEDVRHETTEVFFSPLSEADIRWYVESGEPMDKAGAYGIQGFASRWVEKIAGCYFNVVGLPVPLVWKMLKEGPFRFPVSGLAQET